MIHFDTHGITGIHVNTHSIERVYNCDRLVWLQNSTSDHFTIRGADTLVEGHGQTYRISYAGSDDMEYNWVITDVDTQYVSIKYNHNRKKALIYVNKANESRSMMITVHMTRKDGTVLTAAKRVSIIEANGIQSFTIDDVYYDLNDSSVFVPFDIIPEGYKENCTIYDSSIHSNKLSLDKTSGFGTYIQKNGDIYSQIDTTMSVSVLDDYVLDESELPDYDSFEIVDTIEHASGNYNEVYATSTQKYYEKNNLGQYEEYGIMPTVNSLSNITYYEGKLVIFNNHEYRWNGYEWQDLGDLLYEHYVDSISYSGEGTLQIPFRYHWGTGYRAVATLLYEGVLEDQNKVVIAPCISGNPTSPLALALERYNPYATRHYAGQTYFYDPDSTTSNKTVLNTENIYTMADASNMIVDFTFQHHRATLKNYVDGTSIDAGGTVHTVTGWYDGLYESVLELDASCGVHFIEFKVYDASNNVVHDIKPKLNPVDSSNSVSLYDSVTSTEYRNITEYKPEFVTIGYGERYPIEKYDQKYPADMIIHTDLGWQVLHTATANVTAYRNTLSFKVNGEDVSTGFDMTARLQIGFTVNAPNIDIQVYSYRTVNNINMYSMPGVGYGIVKAGSEGDPNYCTWGATHFKDAEYIDSSALSTPVVNWIQYSDDEHPFIPPLIVGFNHAYTWFYYTVRSTKNGTAQNDNGSVDITNKAYNNYNTLLMDRYTRMVFKVQGTDSYSNYMRIAFDPARSSQKICN